LNFLDIKEEGNFMPSKFLRHSFLHVLKNDHWLIQYLVINKQNFKYVFASTFG